MDSDYNDFVKNYLKNMSSILYYHCMMIAPEEMSWMSMLLRLSKLNQKIQSTSH